MALPNFNIADAMQDFYDAYLSDHLVDLYLHLLILQDYRSAHPRKFAVTLNYFKPSDLYDVVERETNKSTGFFLKNKREQMRMKRQQRIDYNMDCLIARRNDIIYKYGKGLLDGWDHQLILLSE